jgi:predicted nucleic acid-binding protein
MLRISSRRSGLRISAWDWPEGSGLRRVATIESVGSSTRIEGARLTDREVEKLLANIRLGGQFLAAARFVDQHALGLRAGDALHLAIASEHGATVFTLDQRLAEAGPAFGIPAQLLV